jgi:predicted nucleotidyltransferase
MRINKQSAREALPAGPDRLAAVLFGKSMRAILALLFGRPDRRFYTREIARAAGASPSSLQRDLAALTGAGVLARTEDGRQVYYQANPACPVFDELRGLAAKTFGVADVLRRLLARHASRVRLALVYGSVAKGAAGAASDVDVLWVGELRPSELVLQLAAAEKRLARKISVIAYGAEEFADRLAKDHHFLTTILKGPVIWLIGSRQTLDEFAQPKTRKPRARKAALR